MLVLRQETNEGIVFNIQRFTVHDGPGIRTELFLKGCPLRCKWCSNPESYELSQQVGVYSSKCIGIDKCGACIEVCPKATENAIIIQDGKVVGIDRNICDNCLKCHNECPSDALKLWGQKMSVDEAMKVIDKDVSFYKKSGGGVTISGGESLLQWKFTKEIVKRCKEKGIHTCIETALHVKPEVLDEVLPYTDLFITDIKHMDSQVHKKYTGVGNEWVIENIRKLAKSNKPFVLRIPIIPDVNGSEQHINEIGDFIVNHLDNRVKQVQFLRFRRLGEEKYKSIGLPYLMEDVNLERVGVEEHIRKLVNLMVSKGIPAVCGTTEKISL